MNKTCFLTTVLLILCLIFLGSCDANKGGEAVDKNTVVIDFDSLPSGTIQVKASQRVVIKNQGPGDYINLIPVSSGNEGRNFRDDESSSVLKTEINTYVPLPDETGTNEFYGSDVGVSTTGEFLVSTVMKSSKQFVLVDMNTDTPVYVSPDGRSEFYQSFYTYDLSDFEDKSKLVMIEKWGGGQGLTELGSDRGVLDREDWDDRYTRGLGFLDFEGQDSVDLFASFVITANEGYSLEELRENVDETGLPTMKVSIVAPTELEEDEPLSLSSEENCLFVDASKLDSSKTYCLVVSDCDDFEGFGIANVSSPRFTDGKNRGWFIPYKQENGQVYIYLGKINSSFIFQYLCDKTITLKEYEGAESPIHTFEDSIILPVGAHSFVGGKIQSDSETERWVKVRYYNTLEDAQADANELADGMFRTSVKSVGSDGYGSSLNQRDPSDPNEIRVRGRMNLDDVYTVNPSENTVYVKITIRR